MEIKLTEGECVRAIQKYAEQKFHDKNATGRRFDVKIHWRSRAATVTVLRLTPVLKDAIGEIK